MRMSRTALASLLGGMLGAAVLAVLAPVLLWAVQTYVIPGTPTPRAEVVTNIPNRDEALRSNFAGSAPPTSPTSVAGQSWFDSALGYLNIESGAGDAYSSGWSTLAFARQFGGQHTLYVLADAPQPTVTPVGTTGATTYSYYVVASDIFGGRSLVSPVRTITNGNATLDGTNYNTIAWTAVPYARTYAVLKTNTSTALVASTTAVTVNDTGQSTSGYTPPDRNSTADILTEGRFRNFGACVTGYSRYAGGPANYCQRVGNTLADPDHYPAWSDATACTGRSGTMAGTALPAEARFAVLKLIWVSVANNATGSRYNNVAFYSTSGCTASTITSTSVFSTWEQVATTAGTGLARGTEEVLVPLPATNTFYATQDNAGGNGNAEVSAYTVVGYYH